MSRPSQKETRRPQTWPARLQVPTRQVLFENVLRRIQGLAVDLNHIVKVRTC